MLLSALCATDMIKKIKKNNRNRISIINLLKFRIVHILMEACCMVLRLLACIIMYVKVLEIAVN